MYAEKALVAHSQIYSTEKKQVLGQAPSLEEHHRPYLDKKECDSPALQTASVFFIIIWSFVCISSFVHR